MDDARQQIVDSIKAKSNILVTVSTDPSVDELSAALGLTIILNNLDKRASAVFSGTIPPAINFLEPNKTFENSADSLRDFIIALNKEKADHLRYKVDGDVVKIFITPYKTTLSEKDLEFSQGDYNVELVLALGVKDPDHLDKALEAHGKILHDAVVVTITSGSDKSSLGSVDWHDPDASSLSEMIVALADGLKGDQPIFDQQIATALLTGVVSATDRFSNNRTSSKSMTMAAQLMAAGANQQLIAAKLEEAHDIAPSESKSDGEIGGDPNDSEGEGGSELTIDRPGRAPEVKTNEEKVIEPLPPQPGLQEPETEPEPEPEQVPAKSREEVDQLELEKQLAGITSAPTESMADIEKELQQATGVATEGEVTPVVPAVPEISAPEPSLASMPEPVAPAPPEIPEATAETVAPAAPVEPAAPAFVVPVEPVLPPPVEPVVVEPPKIMNEHASAFSVEPDSAKPQINSIQNNPNDGEPTVDPFNVPVVPEEVSPITPNANLGTPEGAAMLASESDPVTPPPQAAPVLPSAPLAPPPISVPELPPLPPLPSSGSLPPLPPPPPPPPVLGQMPGAMPAGAISGDIFGDGNAAAVAPVASPPSEPGQFRIPGS